MSTQASSTLTLPLALSGFLIRCMKETPRPYVKTTGSGAILTKQESSAPAELNVCRRTNDFENAFFTSSPRGTISAFPWN